MILIVLLAKWLSATVESWSFLKLIFSACHDKTIALTIGTAVSMTHLIPFLDFDGDQHLYMYHVPNCAIVIPKEN